MDLRVAWRSLIMSDSPVLIVGAGPTGLVLAIELARRGVPFHLVDRHPRPLAWDRATVVKSRSLEVFAGMGLADTFVQRGRIVRGVNLFVGEAKVASLGFDSLDSPFPFDLGIPEHETERILTERLEQLGGQVERGVEFVGLEQGELSARARLRSLDQTERTLEASWVFGADGVHGGVREASGDQFDGHDNPTQWGVVDAHLSGWGHPSDLAAVQLEPPSVNPIPLADGRWRIYFRPDPNEDHVLKTVGARLAATSPGAQLQDPDEPQLFYTHSRVAQAIAGSGDEAEARALQPDPTASQALVQFLTTPEGRGAAAMAEAEIAFGYDRSPIVDEIVPDARTATSGTQVGFRVGDAAPLARRQGACCLHECIAVPGHSLFVLLGEPDPTALDGGLALARAVSERYGRHVQAWVVTRNAVPGHGTVDELLCDPTGALHERLGADRPCLCVVRPDGHLGLRAEPPSLEALQVHLGR